MAYWRRLASFWLVILFCAFGGYFCLYNLDYIYLNIPQIGEFKVRAAAAFIGCFLAGATMVTLYFGFDSMKKTWLIRQKSKRILDLERQLEIKSPQRSQELPVKKDINLFD